MRSCASLRALATLKAYLLLVSLSGSHHVAATSSDATTTIYSTTTVATTTLTVTLSSNSHHPTTIVSTEAKTSVVAISTSTATSSGTTATTSAKMATTSASSSSGGPFGAEILNSTNYYRKVYEAKPLVWNDTLAEYATKWAKGCVWKHSGGPYGENLANNFANSTLAVDAWGNEESDYNYEKQKFGESTGHFTQLVWQNTTSVGCGLIQCSNSGAGNGGIDGPFLVCEYSPQGNVKGEFNYNVRKPGESADGEPGFGSGAGKQSGVKKSMAALAVAYLLVAAAL